MKIVYFDQNIVIDLAERSESHLQLRRARHLVLELVETGRALFPYSEIHLAESEPMDSGSRKRIGEFWDSISKGYRFLEAKIIRSRQFLDVFHNRPSSFRPSRVLYHEKTGFADNLNPNDLLAQAHRTEQLREVVAYWATLEKEQIYGHIRTIEAAVGARMVMRMFNKMLVGDIPSLSEVFSEYNTIASDIAWEYHDQGYEDDAFFRAVAFMQEKALRVPAIAVECAGLEALAEQYASDAGRTMRQVDESELHHDSRDLAALSNFVPFCDAGVSDGNAINIIKRAYKKIQSTPPRLFPRRDIEGLVSFLESIPAAEPPIDPEREAERTLGKSLISVPWQKNELVGREELLPFNNFRREILPRGGLKVSSTGEIKWPEMLATLEATLGDNREEIGGGEVVVYGYHSTENETVQLFQVQVPFGMFNLRKGEFEAAFDACSSVL